MSGEWITVERYAQGHRIGVSDVMALVREGLVVSREERNRIYVFDPSAGGESEIQGPVRSQEQVRERPREDSHAMVPMSYAEKAMSSIMHLHTEIMEEKEKRIEQERLATGQRQEIADLKMLVGVLEKEIAKLAVGLAGGEESRAQGAEKPRMNAEHEGWVTR